MEWNDPSTKTWNTGDLVTADDLNKYLNANLSYLFAPAYQEIALTGAFSTTSTSYVDVSSMSVTVETTARNLLIVVFGRLYNSVGNYNSTLGINLDGTDYDVNDVTGGMPGPCVLVFQRFVVTPGNHTVKLRLRSSNSGGSASLAGGPTRRLIAVEGVL